MQEGKFYFDNRSKNYFWQLDVTDIT